MYSFNEILKTDGETADLISQEISRQNRNIELIASENFVSKAVMAAMGSPLTNKYAEGYPGKRYYGGCEKVDVIESIAIKRAKELYNAEHANVQPHSGAQANMAVYFSMLELKDTVLGMSLSHGGHLTHGSPVNLSGRHYNFVAYGVDKETGRIDYDELRNTAVKCKPKMIVAGASAYSRIIDFKKISEIAAEVGAYLMVDMAHIAGLVAAGVHPSPVPYADFVTLTSHKTLRGPRGGLILCKEKYAKAIDSGVFPGTQGGPLMHVIAAKAIALKEASGDSFKRYSEQTVKNAAALSKGLIERGFDIVSGGTDNHLMLVDLRNMGITGKDAEKRLDSVNITCNKNTVPFDTQSPFVTSGIRLGTPAVTTRGMKEPEMDTIAEIIKLAMTDFDAKKDELAKTVTELSQRHPLYCE